jgi:hypothetical protein
MHTVDKRGDIDVHNVAVLERAVVGDAVADDAVHRSTNRLRETVVVQVTGVGAATDVSLVGDGVDLIGGDTWSNGFAGLDQHFCRYFARTSKPKERIAVLDLKRAGIADRPGRDIAGRHDVVWHRPWRRDRPKPHRLALQTLAVAVTTLVLRAASAPARAI